jgi:hypothetical protein
LRKSRIGWGDNWKNKGRGIIKHTKRCSQRMWRKLRKERRKNKLITERRVK